MQGMQKSQKKNEKAKKFLSCKSCNVNIGQTKEARLSVCLFARGHSGR